MTVATSVGHNSRASDASKEPQPKVVHAILKMMEQDLQIWHLCCRYFEIRALALIVFVIIG